MALSEQGGALARRLLIERLLRTRSLNGVSSSLITVWETKEIRFVALEEMKEEKKLSTCVSKTKDTSVVSCHSSKQ